MPPAATERDDALHDQLTVLRVTEDDEVTDLRHPPATGELVDEHVVTLVAHVRDGASLDRDAGLGDGRGEGVV